MYVHDLKLRFFRVADRGNTSSPRQRREERETGELILVAPALIFKDFLMRIMLLLLPTGRNMSSQMSINCSYFKGNEEINSYMEEH